MKTEMKKNNKMFLAMAVVAALAMVSFAGVAMQSDDSDAVGLLNPMGDGVNSTTIIEDTTVEAVFYINLDVNQPYGVQFVKIKEGLSVTGTISIGTARSGGVDYIEYASVKLDGVSNAVFTLIMAPEAVNGYIGIILVGDEANVDSSNPDETKQITNYRTVEGTVEVTKGWLMGGAIRPDTEVTAADWVTIMNNGDFEVPLLYNNHDRGTVAPFTGTLKAGDAVIESAYTFGIALGVVDGRATIFNQVGANDSFIPTILDDTQAPMPMVDRSVMGITFVSGEISVGFPEGVSWSNAQFGAANVNVVVEEGAKIIVGDNMPITAASVSLSTASVTGDVLYLVSESGIAIKSDDIVAPGDDFKFNKVKLNTEYMIVGSLNGEAFIATFSVDGSEVDYSVNIGLNEAEGAVSGSTGLGYDTGSVTFDGTYSACIYALSTTTGVLSVDDSAIPGKIKVATGETVFLLLADNASSSYLLYNAVVADPISTNLITAPDPSQAVITETEIVLEDVKNKFYVMQAYGDVYDGYTLTIRGEIESIYTNATIRGEFGSTADVGAPGFQVNFEGTGTLIYGNTPQAKPGNPLTAAVGLNAAYYFVNEGPTTKPTSTTFYYTTLNNALTQNNNITITGTVTIKEDLTLAGPIADEPTNINILANAKLLIGEIGVTEDDVTYSPIVSVPETTTVTKVNSAEYKVVSGQAVYDVDPKLKPVSDVLLEGDKFIYTDLWTAFDISQSGQTIVIRAVADPQPVVISRDTTLKAGVTLDDKNAPVAIDEKVIFTVDGIYDCQNELEINGTMRVNGTVNFINQAKVATIGATGAIDIMASGVVNVGNDTVAGALNGLTDSVVTVAGTLNVNKTSTSTPVSIETLNITGTVSVNSAASLIVNFELIIGEIPEVATKPYSNPAVIEGKINLDPNATATAYGDFILSATGASANLVNNGTLYGVKYMIAETQFCTVYSFNGGQDILSVNGTFKDIIIHDWNNKADLNGRVLSRDGPFIMSDPAWATAYAEFEFREFMVTFEYAPGVTWTYNGKTVNQTTDVALHYGDVITVQPFVAEGYTGTPALTVNGATYSAGASYTVTENATFAATGVHVVGPSDPSGWTLIEILLVIIVVIIGVIAIIVALRLLRS